MIRLTAARRQCASLLATILAIAVYATTIPAHAQDKFSLKLGISATDSVTDPYANGCRLFDAAVQKESGQRINVTLFPNRQIGDEKELMEGLRFGTIDMAIITNAVVANTVPSLQVNDLPFLYASAKQAQDILDGEVGETLRK